MNSEEKKLRAKIAYDIRAELVCCDMYDTVQEEIRKAKVGGWQFYYDDMREYHAICHWAEAAARIAENRSDTLPAGLCGNRDNHDPHEHESKTLGKFWCTADQKSRLPYAAELRRNNE